MREINSILCPVDLSDVSRHAIDHAVLLARWYKARITALHVCDPMVIPMADFTVVGTVPPPMLTEDEINELRARVQACFEVARPIDVDVLVEDGHAANQILAIAKALAADLIVIGTHGAGGFQHLVLGSVTEKVLRQAMCPVLTVPPHARTTSKLPYKRILCPVDFSDSSLAALGFAFSIAREGDAAVTIMHACEWPDADEPPMHEFRLEREGDVAAKLHALVPDSIRDWCHPSTRLAHGKAYREILGVAAEDSSDLIVMGVHGRNALDLMLFGSTTSQVVRRATCPVLTLRK